MNKRIVLPLLIVAPLITSCKGGIVSTTFARGVVANIESILGSGNHAYKKFTYKFSSTYGEETQYIKVTFDNVAQFYNKYVITYTPNADGVYEYHTNEYWSYVKDNKYYDVIRVDGAHSDAEPIVTYVDGDGPKEYKDEYWDDKSSEVIEELHTNYLYYSLRNISSLIDYKDVVSRADVTLSSMNDSSICAEGEVDGVTFKYQIDNAFLSEYSFQYDSTHKKWFTCNYKRAQITYLNL